MRAPTESEKDKKVDRRILQEVDRVGKQRDRANETSHGKLNPEVSEVQKRDESDRLAESWVRITHARMECGLTRQR